MEIGKVNGSSVNSAKVNTVKNQASEDSFEKRLQSAFDKNDEKQLKKACQEFEGIFLNMMYKQMKATVPKSELLPGDAGKDVFDSMLDDKLMEKASESRGIGLADVLYKQLSKSMKATYKPVNGGGKAEVDG